MHLKFKSLVMFKSLIVDDNDLFRQTLKWTFTSQFPSMHIEEAVDGNNKALSIIKSQLPDLIFLDIKLSGENGIQLTKKKKDLYPNIFIIIMTSYNSPEYREAASQAGTEYFILKRSSSTKDIIKVVESVLSRGLQLNQKNRGTKGK